MSTGQPAWILLALLGGVAGTGFFVLLRVRLMSRYNRRSKRDGWERGRLPLAGFGLSLVSLGIGVGGFVATRPPPEDMGWWSTLIRLGPEPLADVPSASPVPEEGSRGWYSTQPPGARPSQPSPSAPPAPVEAAGPRDQDLPYTIATPFGVRVGVFRQTANVDGLVGRLRREGYTPLVVRREDSAGAPVYYLYAGTYATRAEAVAVAREILDRGGDAMVVEIDPSGAGG